MQRVTKCSQQASNKRGARFPAGEGRKKRQRGLVATCPPLPGTIRAFPGMPALAPGMGMWTAPGTICHRGRTFPLVSKNLKLSVCLPACLLSVCLSVFPSRLFPVL